MTPKTEKVVGTSLFVILLVLLACAYINNTVPSYEIDSLKGVYWLLFWASALYLPIFPLIALALSLTTSFRPHDIFTINFTLTLTFCIFAWVIGFQYITWTFFVFASIIPLIAILLDNKKYSRQ